MEYEFINRFPTTDNIQHSNTIMTHVLPAVSESAIQGCSQIAEQMEEWIRIKTQTRVNNSNLL